MAITETNNLPLARSAAEQRFLTTFCHPPRYGVQRITTLSEKVKTFALYFFTAAMFLVETNVFTLGFICGFVWDETCHSAIEKIKTAVVQQGVFGWCAVGFVSFLAMPTVLLTTFFLTAASIGGKCYRTIGFD